MLALPPPPSLSSPATNQTKPLSLDQIVISKQPTNHLSLEPNSSNSAKTKLSRPPALRFQRTNPIIWFASVLCLIFSLVLIFFGVATLTIFLGIKPRNPTFDIPNANLNALYFDSPQYFNGDFTLLANFTNPNTKIDVSFESLDIELFFSDRIISSQSIEPFTQRRRESRLQSLHFISSLVFLPKDLGVKLEKQVQSNLVNYNVRGTFKVRVTLGLIHLSYLLHSRCQIEMTSPPTGGLVARKCITKR